jgi:hypothetical protein
MSHTRAVVEAKERRSTIFFGAGRRRRVGVSTFHQGANFSSTTTDVGNCLHTFVP